MGLVLLLRGHLGMRTIKLLQPTERFFEEFHLLLGHSSSLAAAAEEGESARNEIMNLGPVRLNNGPWPR